MRDILDYLRTTIDNKAEIQKWNAKEYLNLQLAGSYEYYLATVLSESFLLIKPLDDFTIPRIKIHVSHIQEKTGYEVAMLLQAPTAYKIKKMFEEKIAFVAADKQMYLPFLALHIKFSRGKDAEEFINQAKTEPVNLLNLDIKNVTYDELQNAIEICYGLK